MPRNENFGKLTAGYLFPEIGRRRREHLEKNPDAKIISLGIGDTTEPLPRPIAEGLSNASLGLATREGYSGYGAEQGMPPLRKRIGEVFYNNLPIEADEIFVSDGSKCDIGRLQLVFGPNVTVAVQDPSYPVYVDTSVLMGMTGSFDKSISQYKGIEYMLCNPGNDFFPDLAKCKRTDIIYFCSPNNPTGAAATRSQLEELVAFAKKNGSIIVYDSAYARYIEDDNRPQSIYEIPGAQEIAIEVNSFSKYAGFTGVRLGWTVVPKALKFEDGSPVITDFNRVMTTCFNGASNVAQHGGLAALDEITGVPAMNELVGYYKTNAGIIRGEMENCGFKVYGGVNAPYIWVDFSHFGKTSWEMFAEILEKTDIVTTPGSGFGPGGEGFVRISAFGKREDIMEACERFRKTFKK